jgi:hypothetical protein
MKPLTLQQIILFVENDKFSNKYRLYNTYPITLSQLNKSNLNDLLLLGENSKPKILTYLKPPNF